MNAVPKLQNTFSRPLAAASKLQNTFKKPLKVAHKQQDDHYDRVVITDAQMAVYNLVKLKLEYRRNQAQDIYDSVLQSETQKLRRLQKIVTGSIVTVMGLAVVGLIISRIF